MGVTIERVYDFVKRRKKKSEHAVLVDRVWPRGVAKENLDVEEWLRDVAPSNELRKWFGHDPERWEDFRRRYEAELAGARAEIERLREIARKSDLVLLFGARDEERNQAVVLAEVIGEDD